MSRLVRRFSWKFLGLVIIIAIFSLLAPEAWRRLRSQRPLELAASSAEKTAARPLPQFTFEEPLPTFEPPALPAEEPALAPAPAAASDTPLTPNAAAPGLEAFETPQQVAPTRPIVAEQIDLDPSLSEIPTRIAKPIPPMDVPSLTPPTTTGDDPPATPSVTPPDADNLPDQATLKPAEPQPAPLPVGASAGVWPHPTSLIKQLQELKESEPAVAHWAEQAIAALETLAKVDRLDDRQVAGLLDELHTLSLQAKNLAAPLPTENQRSRVLRAGFAIVRRIAIWQLTHAAATESANRDISIPSTADWQACIADLEHKLQSLPGGAPWWTYLRLAEARKKIGNAETAAADRRELARDILRRLNSTQFDPQQGDFAESPVFFGFVRHLKAWADEPVNLTSVLQAIEDYERQDLSAESTSLAQLYQQIRWSPDTRLTELGDTINAYYRNANVRVAISAEMVNRFLPKEARQAELVQDYIQGAYVEGNSEASTRLRLVLLPDRLRWRVGLEANGEVASDTASTKGPATFYQNGVSFYRVRKMLLVDRRGVRMFNAEASAQANNELMDFETSFDGIPLLDSIARSIARSQYDAAQDSARAEVEEKIRGRATSRIDQAMAEQLRKGQANFKEKLLDPMRKLALEPTAVDMQTTHERLIARYRLAGHDQLSAHTPRPQAPGDSLLSVQVHETAMNNLVNHLALTGRRWELRELHKEMASIFTKNPPAPPDDLPEDVYVTFMDSDPVRVDCEDGRIRLTIRVKQLEHGKTKWTNFTVRGYYAPTADQLEANLARDGVIELIGDRLRVGDQLALRGIFSRVLSRNRQLHLINKQIALAPELRDQQVTQLVIHDGWIGVALGPKHPQREALKSTRANPTRSR